MHIVLLENKLGICSRKTLGTKKDMETTWVFIVRGGNK